MVFIVETFFPVSRGCQNRHAISRLRCIRARDAPALASSCCGNETLPMRTGAVDAAAQRWRIAATLKKSSRFNGLAQAVSV